MSGKVFLIGGGPGAPDLLTVRGAELVASADIVIWGRPFLRDEVVTDRARPDAELIPWPPATMADIHAAYDRAATEGLVVARLHSGDPTIFGKLEELAAVRERGLDYEIVPGVSALGAAGAALGVELTSPDGPSTLIVASGREDVRALARHGATMALFMFAAEPAELQRELLAGGYPEDTPCAAVHRASWPEERVLRCRLGELAERLEEAGFERLTVVLVGPSLSM